VSFLHLSQSLWCPLSVMLHAVGFFTCQYLSLSFSCLLIMTSLVSTESSSTHSDRFWQCAGILMTILWLGRCLPVLVLVHCGVQVSSTHDDALSQCLFFTICFCYIWVSSNVNCLQQCFCFWRIFASSLQKEKLVQQIQEWFLWDSQNDKEKRTKFSIFRH
jgi:hypothetical protein